MSCYVGNECLIKISHTVLGFLWLISVKFYYYLDLQIDQISIEIAVFDNYYWFVIVLKHSMYSFERCYQLT